MSLALKTTPDIKAADRDMGPLLAAIRRELENGLPNEKEAIHEAIENQAFFDYDGERYIPVRDAETAFDYESREKRSSGFLRECIDVLTDDLYNPGPARTFDQPAGQEFLERVWNDNLYNTLLNRADQLAHLNRVAAIQVDAAVGDFNERPITYRLWGRDEFHSWTHPRDNTRVVAVVTVDRYDLTTRYRLWTDNEVFTYITEKAENMSVGTVPLLQSVEPNTYKIIPFGFFWYDLPFRSFYPTAIGSFLRKAEVRADDRLSRLDEAIHVHLNPLPIAKNVGRDFQPIIQPGRFLVLNQKRSMGTDGFEVGHSPELEYLQGQPNVEAAWLDLMRFLNQALEAAHVPLSAVRMQESGTASGIALLAEQAPLLKRARKRQSPAGFSEAYIARVTLVAAGNHYGRADLVKAGQAGRLSLAWPVPTIPLPGPDRDESNKAALEIGTKSRIMIIMQEYACDRPQALAILEQIAADRIDEERIDPATAQQKEERPGEPDETEPDEGDEQDDEAPDETEGDEEEGDEEEAEPAKTGGKT